MDSFEYIVIGGGIIGLTTAHELGSRGAKVAIIDSKTLGAGTSWSAGGILSSMRPWAESAASYLLSEHGKKLYPEYVDYLKQQTGIDSEYIRSGLVIIDKNHAAKTKQWAKSEHIEVLESIENLSPDVILPEHLVLLPDIAQIRPPKLLKAIQKSLENLPVTIYENKHIQNLEIKDNQFHSVDIGEKKLIASAVIITAGVWSNSILSKLGKSIELKPVRGQIVCLKSDNNIIDKIILDGAYYLIPRQDGHILIGSTMEDVGFVNETTKVARQELLEWAYTVLPVLKKARPVSHWSGLRPSTLSGRPVIGMIPDFKNVYLNTGHFRKGILQAPSSAKLLVDKLLEKESFTDINNFNMDLSE